MGTFIWRWDYIFTELCWHDTFLDITNMQMPKWRTLIICESVEIFFISLFHAKENREGFFSTVRNTTANKQYLMMGIVYNATFQSEILKRFFARIWAFLKRSRPASDKLQFCTQRLFMEGCFFRISRRTSTD